MAYAQPIAVGQRIGRLEKRVALYADDLLLTLNVPSLSLQGVLDVFSPQRYQGFV